MAGATLLSVALVAAATVGIAAWRTEKVLDAKITRFGDPFAAISAQERASELSDPDPLPAAPGLVAGADVAVTPSSGAMNLLVFGSDSRISAGDPADWVAGAQRTDAIMLVHIPADRSHVYVVSIPRDSWVDVPGHGKAKINAAFSWGGPTLAIRTVERLTKVRIDHMVLTDFTGFAALTDILGGVDIDVAKTTHGDTHGIGTNFTAGTHHMDGATALTYVRQRYVLPGGDFDRVRRQQNWIRSVLRTAASSGAQTDPVKMYALLDTMASSLSTDSQFTIDKIRGLVLSLHGVRSGGVRFMTAPLTGTDTSPDGQSIVRLDTAAGRQLWTAVRQDRMEQWLTATGYDTLGSTIS